MKKRKLYVVFVAICISVLILLWDKPFEECNAIDTSGSCAVYYLLNIDGMKGLGHTALMLTDEQGEGLIYSYNGMQYSLTECLLGKAGIGKMKVFPLGSEEVSEFLTTGDLQVEDTSECDNFDRMLYRYVSREEYEQIQENATKYIETGSIFETLYADFYNAEGEERSAAEEKLNDFLSQKEVPKYQIYVHNCDTVARELIAAIDEEMDLYNSNEKLTPTGNFIGMCSEFSEKWGYRIMGIDTLIEKIFWR